MADQPGSPREAKGASDSMEKKRRDAVQRIAERNKQAHQQAKKQRQESDRIRQLRRGPNAR